MGICGLIALYVYLCITVTIIKRQNIHWLPAVYVSHFRKAMTLLCSYTAVFQSFCSISRLFGPDTNMYLFWDRVGSSSLYWLCSSGVAILYSAWGWPIVRRSLTSFGTCLLSSLVPLFAFDPLEEGGLAEPKLCGKLFSI